MNLPCRREDVYFHELEEETLVFHRGDNQAHCLNPVAALVFARCDGESAVADCALALERRLGLEPGAGEGLVLATLDELRRRQLVDGEQGTTRRELLGRAAAVLPLIGSVALPTPAQAASCVHANDCSANCGVSCSGFGTLFCDGATLCLLRASRNPTAASCLGDHFFDTVPSCRSPDTLFDVDCNAARELGTFYNCCNC